MQLKLVKLDSKSSFVSLLRSKDAAAVVSIKWNLNDVKTIDDQSAYELLAKYPGLFQDVTHEKESRKRAKAEPSQAKAEPPPVTESFSL